MARYIDADNLIEEIASLRVYLGGDCVFTETARDSVLRVINEQPTAEKRTCCNCLYEDVPAGGMPCVDCSNYYTNKFKAKAEKVKDTVYPGE